MRSSIAIDGLMPKEWIKIGGAREHNLKNLTLSLPREKLVVITGLSGSGKSSLAFDTLFAEGQRKYVESLSPHARQFLDRMNKPDVEYITGICPAIALEQKVTVKNSRSTVATVSEIYDYLRLLYARIGRTYSPVSGEEVKKDTYEDVLEYIHELDEDQKVQIFFPLPRQSRDLEDTFEILLQKGFSRIAYEGELYRLEDLLEDEEQREQITDDEIKVLVDRIKVKKDSESHKTRVSDSVQTAFFEGKGKCIVDIVGEEQTTFSNEFKADGIEFEEPNAHLFNFNSPYGACRNCDGFGTIMGIDEDLVVPNKDLSVYENAIACWRGQKMKRWKEKLIEHADKVDFPIHRPYKELTEEEKRLLWEGTDYFGGLDDFFEYLEKKSYKIQFRVMLSRYRGKTVCAECEGTRLRKEANYVKVAGKSVSEVLQMPIEEAADFFENIELTDYEQEVTERILTEIRQRLKFLIKVGLNYLSLSRDSRTLSGGETQRMNLAKF
jgi:excinuclease ABC subunit A